MIRSVAAMSIIDSCNVTLMPGAASYESVSASDIEGIRNLYLATAAHDERIGRGGLSRHKKQQERGRDAPRDVDVSF